MNGMLADAVMFLNKHAELLNFPGLNPSYVVADANRSTLEPAFFSYEDEINAYFHPFHKCLIPQTDYYEIISAYGYGGPVATSEDPIFIKKVLENYRLWCEQEDIVVETIRFHPLINNWRYYYGDVTTVRNTVCVDLASNNLLGSYSTRVRTAIKKAIKNGVVIKLASPEEFLAIFPGLYYELMKKINAKENYFFNHSYFKGIFNLENAFRLLAFLDNEIIGGAIFFIQHKTLEYHLSASNDIGKQLCATNLLLHEAFIYAQKMGCQFAHLGGGVTSASDDPLLFFKLGFAGRLIPFKLGRFIHNSTIYEALLRKGLLLAR